MAHWSERFDLWRIALNKLANVTRALEAQPLSEINVASASEHSQGFAHKNEMLEATQMKFARSGPAGGIAIAHCPAQHRVRRRDPRRAPQRLRPPRPPCPQRRVCPMAAEPEAKAKLTAISRRAVAFFRMGIMWFPSLDRLSAPTPEPLAFCISAANAPEARACPSALETRCHATARLPIASAPKPPGCARSPRKACPREGWRTGLIGHLRAREGGYAVTLRERRGLRFAAGCDAASTPLLLASAPAPGSTATRFQRHCPSPLFFAIADRFAA
jgi:hypothetical protein